jgi:hypothetical protein
MPVAQRKIQLQNSIKIYFSAAISAGRERQPLYARMVEFIFSCGAEVLSTHVARADVLQAESQLTPEEIFRRDTHMIAACDGMIAEASKPSLGVGFEIATCLQQPRPVLCLCEKGVFLTRMLTGNADQRLHVAFYDNDAAWQSAIENFCDELSRKD